MLQLPEQLYDLFSIWAVSDFFEVEVGFVVCTTKLYTLPPNLLVASFNQILKGLCAHITIDCLSP